MRMHEIRANAPACTERCCKLGREESAKCCSSAPMACDPLCHLTGIRQVLEPSWSIAEPLDRNTFDHIVWCEPRRRRRDDMDSDVLVLQRTSEPKHEGARPVPGVTR